MGRAYLVISPQLLASWLHLPDGSVIDPTGHHEAYAAEVELTVEHPDIPDTPFGHPLPTVVPTFRQDAPDARPQFLDWNVRRD